MTAAKKKALIDTLIKTETVNAVLSLIKTNEPITMEAIARECKMAKGTIYNYFKNKADLMAYVHQAILEPIKDSKGSILESDKDPLSRLYEFIDAVFDTNEDVRLYFQFIQHKRSVASEIQERQDIIMIPLARLCQQGIDQNLFMDVDPAILAEAIYGIVISPLKSISHTTVQQHRLETVKQDVLRLIQRIVLAEQRKK